MTESNDRPDLSTVVTLGDYRRSLEAIRDRLVDEVADARWATHKRECSCVCGIGDARVVVAVLKELRAVLDVLDKMPAPAEVSELDRLRNRRAHRLAAAPDPDGAAVHDVSGA